MGPSGSWSFDSGGLIGVSARRGVANLEGRGELGYLDVPSLLSLRNENPAIGFLPMK